MADLEPRRRRRFRLVIPATAGVAAAAAVALVVGLSGTPRGPDAAPTPTVQTPKVLTAAMVLDYATEAAIADQTPAPRPDQYVYTKLVTEHGYVERWTSAGHKRGGYLITTLPGMKGETGPTPACLEVTVAVPTPHGDKYYKECSADGGYLAADPKTTEETMRFLSAAFGMHGEVDPRGFFKSATMALANYLVSPPLRAAIFKALNELRVPGQEIVVREHQRDLVGREGVGLELRIDGHPIQEFIFDTKTYQLLGAPDGAITVRKVVDHLKQR